MDVSGIYNQEMILIDEQTADDEVTMHYIMLTMFDDKPMFSVTSCCDDDWEYTFTYTRNNYESIKHLIVDMAYECESMEELLDNLSDMFVSEFEDILSVCDGNCEECEFCDED